MKHLFVSPHPTQLIAVVVTLLPEGKRQLAGCLLQKKADAILIEQHWPELTSLEALTTLVPSATVPVGLVLEGRGVLHKALPASAPMPPTDAEALALVLPGAASTDFGVQRDAGAGSQFVSLVRQETTTGLLAEVHKLGRHVFALEVGPFSLQALTPFLGPDWQQTSARVGNYTVSLQAGQVAELVPLSAEAATPAKHRIGEQELTAHTLLAYAAGVRALVGQAPAPLLPALLAQERQSWQQKQVFRNRGLGLLALFLGTLLLNFLLFSQFTAHNQQLSAQATYSRQKLQLMAGLKQKLQQQHAFLQSAGWLAATNQSVYADQLAATVPAGLQLTWLELNPHDDAASRQRQEAVFIQHSVLVKGRCRDARILNNWLQVLGKQPWVKQIEQQNFAYDYAAGVGTFSFTIQLPVAP